MMFSLLASGSDGNLAAVWDDSACVLIDAGVPLSRARSLLSQHSIPTPDQILVTHNHKDHAAFLRDYQSFWRGSPKVPRFTMTRVPVNHGGPESAGFVFTCQTPMSERRLAFFTDVGQVTLEIEQAMSGSHVLAIEANYSPNMLQASERDARLKARIAGGRGHLSNQEAGTLAAKCGENLHTVVLLHLSSECNLPNLAAQTVRNVVGNKRLHIRSLQDGQGMIKFEV